MCQNGGKLRDDCSCQCTIDYEGPTCTQSKIMFLYPHHNSPLRLVYSLQILITLHLCFLFHRNQGNIDSKVVCASCVEYQRFSVFAKMFHAIG